MRHERAFRRHHLSAHSHPQRRQEQPMAPTSETQPAPEEPVVEETLVEEVSIDGMCGVY